MNLIVKYLKKVVCLGCSRNALCFLFSLCVSISVFAEVVYETDVNSQVSVEGTSSLHEWHVKSETLNGKIQIEDAFLSVDQVKNMISLNSLDQNPMVSLSIPVETLKSGKKAMDKKMYSALELKKNPEINYQLESLVIKEWLPVEEEGQFKLVMDSAGLLTIAGNQQKIDMPIQVTSISQENQIIVEGQITFKMSDFGIDPPTALLGTLKTGDEITVKFNWNLKS